MKKFTALIRENRGGHLHHMTKKTESKKQFTEDLRGNGYRVITVLTENQIEDLQHKGEEEYFFSINWKNRKQKMEIYNYIQQVF